MKTMKISEHIAALQSFIDQHGDIELVGMKPNYEIGAPSEPMLRHRRINNKRQSRNDTFSIHNDKPEQKGSPVCLVW